MAPILKRTVFERIRSDGTKQDSEWAQIITSRGTMVEPFAPGLLGMATGSAYDPQDDCVRVDERKPVADGRELMVLISGDTGGQAVHGGNLWLK